MKIQNNGILYRRLRENEIPAALALSAEVFTEFEAPEYVPEGTAEFLRSLADESYLKGLVYWGAFEGETLIGMLAIREQACHICLFFVRGDRHRRGIGRALFTCAREAFAGKTLTLNAAPYALAFYEALGFETTDEEQTVNGIRFTPMCLRGEEKGIRIVTLRERRDLKDRAAAWFSGKWSVPKEAYLESMEASFSAAAVPSWYLCLDGAKIVAGMGVIENDFHDRPDLAPNVCAVYTEPEYRCRGLAGRLLHFVCADMAARGIGTLYLLTDHSGFYERYGWEYLCPATGEGEDRPSRMYVHRAEA